MLWFWSLATRVFMKDRCTVTTEETKTISATTWWILWSKCHRGNQCKSFEFIFFFTSLHPTFCIWIFKLKMSYLWWQVDISNQFSYDDLTTSENVLWDMKQNLIAPRIELGTFCVLGRCDNRYTTRSCVGGRGLDEPICCAMSNVKEKKSSFQVEKEVIQVRLGWIVRQLVTVK